MNHNKARKLLVKYFLGGINPTEKALLDSWLEESARHQELFDRLRNDNSLKTRYDIYMDIDSEEAWKEFKKDCLPHRNIHRVVLRYAAMFLLPLVIAAVAWYYNIYTLKEDTLLNEKTVAAADSIRPGISEAILCLPHQRAKVLQSTGKIVAAGPIRNVVVQSGILIYPQRHDYIAQKNEAEGMNEKEESHTLSTRKGNEFRVIFEDGTEVHLNYDTKLRYPANFDSKERVVYLEGEAYFKIAKDSRPFYVVTQNGTVKQYGTEFNVNTFNSGTTEVALVRGSISIIPKGGTGEKHLMPGQLACSARNGSVSIQNVDITPYVAWNDGRLVFEDKRLEDIMKILARWYSVDVVFESDELKDLHFTGDMDRYGTIIPFLNAIKRATDINMDIQGKRIVITTN